MNIEITVANYRCFSDAHPARFTIGPGFTGVVGVNNSGKSSLLRFLYDFRELFQLFHKTETVRMLANKAPYGFGGGSQLLDTLSNHNSRPMKIAIKSDDPQVQLELTYGRDGSLGMTHTQPESRAHYGSTVSYPDSALTDVITSLANTMYAGPFRNILNFSPSGFVLGLDRPVYHDLFIGQQFIQAWRRWKVGSDRQGNELAVRITDDLARIFGLNRLEINASEGERTLKLLIDGKSYDLEDLGSGLAQFIVVLTNAAFKKPAFILIDEPELNLHPALQLDFLTTLASYAQIGVVFATHNLGLARSLGNRIYSTSRHRGGTCTLRQLEATPRLPEFLGEMSFSAHRELGFEKLLLVEGATEITTIQQFLRKLNKEHEVMLLPLGGTATINGRTAAVQQLEEVLRITPHVAALIDSERTSSEDSLKPDRVAFEAACKHLGIRIHVLQRRATENYLPDRAVKAVKGAGFRALEHYESLRTLSNGWAKADNWRIAAEMTTEELSATDLGQFLTEL